MVKKLDYEIARRRMVEEQLCGRGIKNEWIIEAFMRVPRHLFVDPAIGSRAYDDCSFPIGYSQTISQPYTIAFMVEALGIEKNDRVLEIGTGSGYQTAIISLLAREVFSLERVASLSKKAETVLHSIQTGRIRLKVEDGFFGWKHYAPFDQIIVSAAMTERPHKLFEQLTEGGTLIAPVVDGSEHIMLFKKNGDSILEKRLTKCSFVPLKKGIR